MNTIIIIIATIILLLTNERIHSQQPCMVKNIYLEINNSFITPTFTKTNATGYEMWKSNGSVAETIMVKDIYTGSNSSSLLNSSFLYNLTTINGMLYFAVGNEIDDTKL